MDKEKNMQEINSDELEEISGGIGTSKTTVLKRKRKCVDCGKEFDYYDDLFAGFPGIVARYYINSRCPECRKKKSYKPKN